MIESLRRWGGQFANAPIVAVTPRLGPSLRTTTKQALQRLNVEYLHFIADNPYSWKSFLNRHYALLAVEQQVNTELIGWIDSDLLFLNHPHELALKPHEDVAACPHDKNMGTSGPDDPHDPYWQAACHAVGLQIDQLPWVTTEVEQARIRLYWNGGVYIYRRSTQFAQHNLQTTLKLLNARIASRAAGTFFTQHTLGMTTVQQGLCWKALPHSHNYGLGSKTLAQRYTPEKLKQAAILHYHDLMWMPHWETLLHILRDTHPEVADWLAPQGPLSDQLPFHWQVINKAFKVTRAWQGKRYQQSCRVI
ncbi:MAG TPA: hypothetical protein IGS37_07495 [Synechococcales cyanobacterium M55_K2018_004]|nr:hypothetical protein [Synechococcales cyanobacterium M55_K2018_004]